MPAWRWRLAQAAEIRWWRRYLRGRDRDAYAGWKRGYWRTLLDELRLSPKPGSRVLDAGCGPAGIFTALPHCEVVAVDPLLPRYEGLEHFVRGDYPHVRFVADELERFAPERDFDYVFCLNVVNHVRDLARVFAVLAQAARPGAPVVVSVDAHRHVWLKPIFRAVPGDILHPHQYDLEEYVRLAEASGLDVIARRRYRREALFDYWVLTCAAPT